MNPSAPDWILKFFNLFDRNELVHQFTDEDDFYDQLKGTGFTYGISISFLPKKKNNLLKLSREEITKVNLFHALVYQHLTKFPTHTDEDIIKDIVSFYKELEKGKIGFFHKFSLTHTPSHNLENILSARLQEANTLFKRNSLSLLTYAFLYLDVLSYRHWLQDHKTVKEFNQQLEDGVLNYCFFTLKSKQKKSKYDKLLIELYESSSGYVLEEDTDGGPEFRNKLRFLREAAILERRYILDMCCLTIWEDLKVDDTEYQYLLQLIDILELTERQLKESLNELQAFSEIYSDKIMLFEYSSPVKQFYKQSASTVKLLILRNKDRLLRELEESGELIVLLGQSTRRDLSVQEKDKVKKQLLDICKSIPSLTIFLLPGGSVLLPLLVKFIPRLLPSAFQDNRID